MTKAGTDTAVPASSPTESGESGRDPIPGVIRPGNDSGAARTASP